MINKSKTQAYKDSWAMGTLGDLPSQRSYFALGRSYSFLFLSLLQLSISKYGFGAENLGGFLLTEY